MGKGGGRGRRSKVRLKEEATGRKEKERVCREGQKGWGGEER